MSKKTKKTLLSAFMMVGGTLFLWLCLNACHYVGVARAQAMGAGVPSAPDPTSTIVDMLTSGQYLPAIGALLVAITGALRIGAVKIQWKGLGAFFGSQIGGYVLAYAVAMLTYLGTALEQSQHITLKLVLMGLTSALTAAGILDHWRDILGAVKKVPPAAATLAVALFGVTVLGCSPGCGSTTQDVINSKPAQAVVDCVKENQALIEAGAAQCGLKAPDWSAVETCVVASAPSLGYKIGGCIMGKLVTDYLTKKSTALDAPQSHEASNALEDYRAKYLSGATIHTAQGDL